MPVSLITGAGSGIGRATAVQLASEGHALALVGRRLAPLEETARECRSDDILIVTADIAAPGAAGVNTMIDAALKRFGRLDTLINNAGLAPLHPIDGHTPPVIERTFAVNALAPAWAIARAWAVFVRQKSGCIINISSMATVDPFPGLFGYAAAKASVNLMARSAANEGRAHNIRAFSIAPGAVDTEMLEANFPGVPRARRLSPGSIARLVSACIRGEHDARNGDTILAPSP